MRLRGLGLKLVLGLRFRLLRLRLQVSFGKFLYVHMLSALFLKIDVHVLEISKWHSTLSTSFVHMHHASAANRCSGRRRESAELSEKHVHLPSTLVSEIADAPSAASTTTSSAAPTATGYKEGRFRVRTAPPGTSGYMASYDGSTAQAVPRGVEVNFVPTADESLAVIFETVPGESGKVLLYNFLGEPLYLNIDREAGGPVYVNTQASIDSDRFLPISLFVLQNDSIIVKNLGLDEADPADDSSTILLCVSRGPTYQM